MTSFLTRARSTADRARANLSVRSAFTLVELMVCLTIIAVLTMVTVPHAGRSDVSRDLYDTCGTLVEMLRYAKHAAAQTGNAVQFTIGEAGEGCFVTAKSLSLGPIKEGILRQRHFPAKHLLFSEFVGFETTVEGHALVFDPTEPWPRAHFIVSGGDAHRMLSISGETARFEELEDYSKVW